MASAPPASAPTFSIHATDGKARAGVLRTAHGALLPTPACLLYTRRGAPLSLTPDLLAQPLAAEVGYQLNTMHFLSSPSPETLSKHGGAARGYLGLDPARPILASNRDPTVYEYGIASAGKPSTDAGGVHVATHAGVVQVGYAEYVRAVAAIQPDLWVTLCDEVPADPALSAKKRTATAVDRTSKWLDACLATAAAAASASSSSASEQPSPLAERALAAIAGGADPGERARSARAAAAARTPAPAGFALCGFGTGEDPADRPTLLAAALAELPPDKPRFISGLATPGDVLAGVLAGVDVFDDGYVHTVTRAGCALRFPFLGADGRPRDPYPKAASQGEQEDSGDGDGDDANDGGPATKLNLWSIAYRQDKRPLVPGCKCYACARPHSRAYIHHILQANEMLADVLLEAHNTHQYQAFMGAVRAAIEAGALARFAATFDAALLPQPPKQQQQQQQQQQARPVKRWSASSTPAREAATELAQGGMGQQGHQPPA